MTQQHIDSFTGYPVIVFLKRGDKKLTGRLERDIEAKTFTVGGKTFRRQDIYKITKK